MEIVNFMKSIFNPKYSSHKRRPEDDLEILSENKIRRTTYMDSFATPEDELPILSSKHRIQRNTLLDPIKTPFSSLKFDAPIVIQDDDCVEVPINGTDRFSKLPSVLHRRGATSTPCRSRNGTDLGSPVARTFGSPFSLERKPLAASILPRRKPAVQNGVATHVFHSIKDLKLFNQPRNPFKSSRVPTRDNVLNQSFRLDDKRKYQELLRQLAPSTCSGRDDSDTFQNYVTTSGLFQTRSKRIMGLAQQKKSPPSHTTPVVTVDLTTSSKSSGSSNNRLSTRECITKVLDDIDTEVIKDSDSDVEVVVLPEPPEPRPDIKVDRINSLRSTDPEERFHSDWMKNLLRSHKQGFADRQTKITAQESHLKRISEITTELKEKRLQAQVRRCLRIKDDIILSAEDEQPEDVPLPVLTEKQESVIDNALNKRYSGSEILSKKFNLSISRNDLLTLAGLSWLNDEVINFYMNLIIERGKLNDFPTAYAMNTFFYMRLCANGHSAVKRWTKKVDIFANDIIAVPIHLRMHWCMAIVDFRSKEVNYYDSMGSANQGCLDLLLGYLKAEHLDKKQTPFDTTGWKLSNVSGIPQQMNGSDCGMFACTFAEFLTRDAQITFAQQDMPYLRRKMVAEIIEGRLLIS